jgi:hypothetical protein
MTPKEKAEELVDKFEVSFAGIISNDEDWETLAKQCALIAVDDILHVLNKIIEITGSSFVFDQIQYYQEVKKEIELL